MKRLLFDGTFAVAIVLTYSLSSADAQSVTYLGSTFDITDYTDLGINKSTGDGWWFANFDTGAPETGQPVAQNAVDMLPGWAQLDNNFTTDPNTSTYSWSQDVILGSLVNFASSTGGQAGYNTITLPDGTTGLSGQAVDSKEAGNGGQSNDIVDRLVLGSGTPRSFILHVVVDNEDAGTMTGVRRVKAKLDDGTPAELEADTGNGIDDTRNNIADIHSFLYEGIDPGDIVGIQLRNSNVSTAAGTGMAGFMIDVIPEPSSLLLSALAMMGLGSVRRRRL